MGEDYAVVEIIDAVLLLSVGVAVFAIIAISLLPLPIPASPPKVSLSAYIRGDYVFIEHMGGDALNFSLVKIDLSIGGKRMAKPKLHEINRNGLWECGEFVRYPYNSTDLVSVLVIDTNSNTVLLHGNLKRGVKPYIGVPPPLLVSSLRTNTTDEDLTCYAPYVENFDAETFIYSWKINGESFAEIIMPFDTDDSSFTRDYSGNGYDGIVNGAKWVKGGKVGGCYFFDGLDDSIYSVLPSLFDNIAENNFTISAWINFLDSKEGCILEAYKNETNFVKLSIENGTLNFGVCKEGKKYGVRSSALANNTWYYISVTWKANENDLRIYVNSDECTLPGSRSFNGGKIRRLSIGSCTNGSEVFLGYIDELVIYKRCLTDAQIHQNYLDTKDGLTDHRTIVADETELGEIWSCTIFPNDGNRDGKEVESNLLLISSYPGGSTS